jgi:uncharacterized protein YbjT (DUF2867 family)
MKVLITGASGFVGRAVSEAVIREGHSVRRMARGIRLQDAGTDWVKGSVLCPEDLRQALDGCDAVVHLVGIIGEVGDQTFERVHHEATLRVVEAALACGVRRMVHMSALGTRPNAISRYHQTKWAAEEVVRSSGLAWTVFRPSLIYGPGDGFVGLFTRMSRWSPVLPVIGRGTSMLQPVAVECVAQAFARALASKAAGGTLRKLPLLSRLLAKEAKRPLPAGRSGGSADFERQCSVRVRKCAARLGDAVRILADVKLGRDGILNREQERPLRVSPAASRFCVVAAVAPGDADTRCRKI